MMRYRTTAKNHLKFHRLFGTKEEMKTPDKGLIIKYNKKLPTFNSNIGELLFWSSITAIKKQYKVILLVIA